MYTIVMQKCVCTIMYNSLFLCYLVGPSNTLLMIFVCAGIYVPSFPMLSITAARYYVMIFSRESVSSAVGVRGGPDMHPHRTNEGGFPPVGAISKQEILQQNRMRRHINQLREKKVKMEEEVEQCRLVKLGKIFYTPMTTFCLSSNKGNPWWHAEKI